MEAIASLLYTTLILVGCVVCAESGLMIRVLLTIGKPFVRVSLDVLRLLNRRKGLGNTYRERRKGVQRNGRLNFCGIYEL